MEEIHDMDVDEEEEEEQIDEKTLILNSQIMRNACFL